MNNPFANITELLTSGGDSRIILGPEGLNKYGCPPFPEPTVLAYGSATASTISEKSFAAAEKLYNRLLDNSEPPHIIYARELDRIRAELISLCELETILGPKIIFAPSGTDAHLFAGQLVRKNDSPLAVITLEPEETGSGVPEALSGKTDGGKINAGNILISVHAREKDGGLRPEATITAEIESHAIANIKSGHNVLLVLTDVSKTGLIFPSVNCVSDLHKKFPSEIDVLIDACQFRISPQALKSYLELGFMVAITGSKFITGQAFSGALLLPKTLAQKFRGKLPPENENYGLLLRWEAALEELRTFHALPGDAVKSFLQDFASAVSGRISSDSAFEPLPVNKPSRGHFPEDWSNIPTIFPFLLQRKKSNGARELLNREETKRVYDLMGKDPLPCQIGQPVKCGARNGVPISALRLCNSARLICDAVSPHERGADAVIKEAMQVLDKAAGLASTLS